MPTLYLLIGGNQGDRQQMITQATDLIRQRIGSVVACSHIYETAPWGLFAPDENPQGFYNQALEVETPLPPHDALKEALDIEHQLGRRRKGIENLKLKNEKLLPQSNYSNNQAIKQSSNHKRIENLKLKIEKLLPQSNYSNNQAIKQSSNHKIPHPDNFQLSTFNFQFYSSRPIDIDLILYDNLVIDTPDLTLPHPRMHLRRFVLVPMCDIAPDLTHPVLNKTMKQLLDECTDTSSCTPCC